MAINIKIQEKYDKEFSSEYTYCCKELADLNEHNCGCLFNSIDGINIGIKKGLYDDEPSWYNLKFCPFCGKKLDIKLEVETIK